GPARVAFSPKLPGTVFHRRIENDRFFLTGGSFLACTPGIDLDMRFGGLKAFFSSEGAFFIEVSGTGDVFYNSFGAVVEREVDGSLLVDNGHLVAWEPTLDWKLTSSGGVKQTLFSGEGLLMRFEGRGKVLLQSRHLASLANWLRPYCN
ncbi:MAG: TIGR00266 family protein, partial [Planctomycetota bacterium]